MPSSLRTILNPRPPAGVKTPCAYFASGRAVALPADAGNRLAIGAEPGVSIDWQRRALVPAIWGWPATAPALLQGVRQQ
jgi:hypothetical protein